MSKLFTLSKKERLKSKKDIETLFQTGKAFFVPPYKMLYRLTDNPENQKPGLQFMASVPKKNFRKAVQRNRIRRKMKEAYRLQNLAIKIALQTKQRSLHLIVIYHHAEEIPYLLHQQAMQKLLLKLETVI